MEKKKNNAVEKVENATANLENKKNSKQSKAKKAKSKKAILSERKKLAQEKKRKRQEMREQKRQKRELIKAEREKAMAEKRVELARIKAHKKAEKEKAKATALREKNRKKAEYKEKRQQIKAEREKRRHEAREKRKRERRGLGGWITAVVSLGIATLALASVLTFTFMTPSESDGMLESAYRKSYLGTVEQVENIDLNLSKAIATSDQSAMQKYLVDTAINSELAENDIQQLPIADESKYYTTKLINQIGDYAKYLNNKLANGEKLTEQDLSGLIGLRKANKTLKDALDRTTQKMQSGYSFSSLMQGGAGDLVIENFNELQNLSVEYPELIYDGPFSDGQVDRELKGLTGQEIDKATAREIFVKTFANYNLENVADAGEVVSGNLEAYNFSADKNGENLYAQISKKGGKLIMFAYAGSCKSTDISEQKAIERGQEFLEKLGITNMKPVWVNLANNVYTINFAYEQKGVIVYSDLIKVRVCAETDTVIGLEAKSYYTNHAERIISDPTITENQAEQKVSSNIDIENGRLVVVPIGISSEKLCYEFSGSMDGATYYVYIDATTGRQVEMFMVVDGTEGQLLM